MSKPAQHFESFSYTARLEGFGQGFMAHDERKPLDANPYQPTSILAAEWDDGWYAAEAIWPWS